MVEHTAAYRMMKHQITMLKNGQVNILTPQPINREQALAIFRGILHDQVVSSYLSNSGLTEDEAELLHMLIEGESHD